MPPWELPQPERSLSTLAFASLSPSAGTRPRMRQQKPHPLRHQLMGPALTQRARHHSLLAHRGPTMWPAAASPRRPPTRERGPSAGKLSPSRKSGRWPTWAGPLTAPSKVRGACLRAGARVCVRGLESPSPGMSGSHVFQIQAHVSEVISGKMLTLITAIKGNTAAANINVSLERA